MHVYGYSVFYFDSFTSFYFTYSRTHEHKHIFNLCHPNWWYTHSYSACLVKQRFDFVELGPILINFTLVFFIERFFVVCHFSFISVFCAFWTGLSGCWRRSAGAITATAILMLLTCLLAAGAMGLWHTVEFFEKEKVVGEEFYQQWTNILRDNTRISYDWSYLLAWAGVASSLVAAILLSGAAVCLRSEREKEEQLNLQYLMPGKCDIHHHLLCNDMTWHGTPGYALLCHTMYINYINYT